MNHIPHHELARAARAQRLGLSADPAALAALLEQAQALRDVALDEVTEERDTLKECLAMAHEAARAAAAALRHVTEQLAELRTALDEEDEPPARGWLRDLADRLDEELEALDVQLSEVRNQTTD